MKYIYAEDFGLIIFEKHNVHDVIAKKLEIKDKVISAGNIVITPLRGVVTYGESLTLGTAPRKEDAIRIETLLTNT